ncbi:hypothetical protein [Algoriphagus sp.]|uniref:hypothetical protein n=1 Tax=Algoriphagus sp. TaxID=1872435 RepID=UPI00391A86BE
MRAYVINWQGPYNYDNLNQNKHKNVLYLITGKKKINGLIYYYCGITTSTVYKRINDPYHKNWGVKSGKEFWVGVIERKNKPSRSLLEALENVIINFWQPQLNKNKLNLKPKKRIVIINQWLNLDGEFRVNKKYFAQEINDFIFYNGDEWRVSNKIYSI